MIARRPRSTVAVGVHGHPVARVLDAPHGRAEHDPLLAELLRHPQRDQLRAADEAVLLGAALGVEEHLEAARRVDVEEHVQERHVLGLGGPDGLDAELEQRAAALRGEVAAHPGGRASGRRAFAAFGASQGALERNVAREPVEPALGALHVEQHQRVDARDRAPVAAQRCRRTRSRCGPGRGWGRSPRRAPLPARRAGPGSGRSTARPPRPRCRRRCRGSARARPRAHAPPRPRPRPRARPAARAAVRPASPAPTTTTSASCVGESGTAADPTSLPCPVRMPPATRSAEREEERRLNTRTLTIASVASASAAAVTSQLWIPGTWIAAALTPVLVTLVSEVLHRPTERIARAWTSDQPAARQAGREATRGRGGAPRRPAAPRDAEPAPPDTAGPVRVYRQPTAAPAAAGGSRSARWPPPRRSPSDRRWWRSPPATSSRAGRSARAPAAPRSSAAGSTQATGRSSERAGPDDRSRRRPDQTGTTTGPGADHRHGARPAPRRRHRAGHAADRPHRRRRRSRPQAQLP